MDENGQNYTGDEAKGVKPEFEGDNAPLVGPDLPPTPEESLKANQDAKTDNSWQPSTLRAPEPPSVEPPNPPSADRPARELTGHKLNPANDQLRVLVEDGVGAGGANHRYGIYGFDPKTNPSADDDAVDNRLLILFQNGPIGEKGVNGVTHEALLAVLIDRLKAFQRGPFACQENEMALGRLQEALHILKHRTRARVARGVEGTRTRS